MPDEPNTTLEKLAYYLKDRYTLFVRKEIDAGRAIPSQADFARWLGVNPASLSNWMNALRPPNPENIDAIASRLGLTIYQIMEVPPRVPNDMIFRQVVARWHKLTDEQREVIADQAVGWADES